MNLDPEQMYLLTALGRAFLLELEKGADSKATLFARAFLACREFKSEKVPVQRVLNSFFFTLP